MNASKRLLILCVLLVVAVGTARAGALEDGQAAYDRGDYAIALRLWTPLAERGDLEAQTGLGDYYMILVGGNYRSPREAVKWYRLAADQGGSQPSAT